jgi:PAS domain S-box-containing protein
MHNIGMAGVNALLTEPATQADDLSGWMAFPWPVAELSAGQRILRANPVFQQLFPEAGLADETLWEVLSRCGASISGDDRGATCHLGDDRVFRVDVSGSMAIFIDITQERRSSGRMKQALVQVSQHLQSLSAQDADMRREARSHKLALRTTLSGVLEQDLVTGEIRATPRMMELIPGFTGFGGSETFDVFHPDERESVRRMWLDHLGASEPDDILHTEARLDPSRGERWVLIRVILVRDEAGTPTDAFMVVRDINESRRQEEALIKAREAAEAATTAKSNFLATMSHEIRTPMNGVLGLAQSLLEDDLNDSQRERVQTILDSGRTLTSLLNDILDLSKVEAGRLEVYPIDGDLRFALQMTVRLFEFRVQERGLSLHTRIDPDFPDLVSFDPVRIRQCLVNLLSNATKFTEAGGVTVSLGWVPGGGNEGEIAITVRDTGIGMTPDTLSRLFARFSQADASISRKYGGSGLGLYIVQQLASVMGGSVRVTSELGVGSEIILRIPSRSRESSSYVYTRNQRLAEHGPATNLFLGCKVLLVDDNAVNRQVAKIFLRPFAPNLVEAVNGVEALDALAREPFDIVLLDIHMPVMTGVEAISRIRTSGQHWSQIPVIAMTADALTGDRERYLAMGMNEYIAKPIDMRELATAIIAQLADRELVGKAPAAMVAEITRVA